METHVIPAMERLIKWLPLHFPDSQEVTVVHGDFRYCLADGIFVEHLLGGRGGAKVLPYFPPADPLPGKLGTETDSTNAARMLGNHKLCLQYSELSAGAGNNDIWCL